MKFFLYDRKRKIIIILILFITTVLSTSFSLLNWYLTKLTPNINEVVENKLEKITYEIVMNTITDDLINEKNLNDILNTTKNSAGEILFVDYNLEKAYNINNQINKNIINNLKLLKNGNLENSEFNVANNSIYIEVPLFISSNNTIISNLGPNIYVKIDYIDTVITNLKTKITSYGLNNVLNELFVTVEIKELITTPVSSKEIIVKYDILLDATMINGRVPSIYGGEYILESEIVDNNVE